MGEIKECGLCGSTDLPVILDMGEQPLAERYGTDARFPLAVAECGDCTLLQLTWAADPAQVFPPDHPYASGDTAVLREHFAALAAELDPGAGLVVDIGANDGTLLEYFGGDVLRVAVEPTGQAAKCRSKELVTYQEFFSRELAQRIVAEYGRARVVTATNVLAHVPDVHGFVAGVTALLDDDGVFVAETHDAAAITTGLQVDTVYHEHLRYFTLATLASLLAAHGLQVERAERIGTHGGSIRVRARRRTGALQERADSAAHALWRMLFEVTEDGSRVYGIGATTRATPLIHFAGIAGFIACVCEVPGSAKIGLTIPGTTIPVVDEQRLLDEQPEYALLLSWHVAATITRKLRTAGYRGKFIVPLPEPQVI
jgi:2-polyprenyl-3-methyl-5-hydroxy-6-metoxy-1,4-benzoquinol methylase